MSKKHRRHRRPAAEQPPESYVLDEEATREARRVATKVANEIWPEDADKGEVIVNVYKKKKS